MRLSLDNLGSNATAIATALRIRADDRAITTLPLAYCYGLSVLNSHLDRGASVALTDRSVIEPAFWQLFRATRATTLAGVPYTFDLLDRIGWDRMELPSLRSVTQAGGRLDPSRVRRYAEFGRRRGWDLTVMYGQTEATARMTYLPPVLAAARPESIGVPIPGGAIRLEAAPDTPAGAGEIVYSGPNVMLGYADGPADLVLGRTVHELRTGDVARQAADGTYEIVGRRSEFLKIAGLRIDPHAMEHLVERHGARASVVGTDDRLVVFAEGGAAESARVLDLVRDAICIPAASVRVVALPELPRLANGKVDRASLRALAAAPEPGAGERVEVVDTLGAIRHLYATGLGRSRVGDDDTFTSLGGDSLSYVAITLGLEETLGHLPDRWATMSIRELAALRRPAGRERPRPALLRTRSVETGIALRALAIVLVVATHIGMIAAPGGAHVLMAVAGYNFGRFRLTAASRGDRVRSQLAATARIALPAMAWVAAVMLLTGEYELRHMLLVNALVRDELWGNLWFIELLVYISLAMAALLAVPGLDRAERRWPFASAVAVLGAGLLSRFGVVDVGIPYTMPVLWLFALGWAASRADTRGRRALLLAIAAVSVPGYFDSPERNAIILAGVALLVVVPRIRLPAAAARAAAVLAAASLAIYLVHWEVWPLFDGWYGVPSLVASLAAGIALWLGASKVPSITGRGMDAVRRGATRPIGIGGTGAGRQAVGRSGLGGLAVHPETAPRRG